MFTLNDKLLGTMRNMTAGYRPIQDKPQIWLAGCVGSCKGGCRNNCKGCKGTCRGKCKGSSK
jgi:modification target Cys-rich repeat protein